MTRDSILQMLYSAVDELNQMLPPGERLEKDESAPLAGESGSLDSAGLINLIVLTEQRTADVSGAALVLTDDETLSSVDQIFATLGKLADHIHRRLNEAENG